MNYSIIQLDPETISELDTKIRGVVILLNKYGFKTFESCDGGDGHCFDSPTIRFFGDEYDLIRAFELCVELGVKDKYNLIPIEAKRVYRKEDIYEEVQFGKPIGEFWGKPINELVFLNALPS